MGRRGIGREPAAATENATVLNRAMLEGSAFSVLPALRGACELWEAMEREGLETLPLYLEGYRRPTARGVFEIFESTPSATTSA